MRDGFLDEPFVIILIFLRNSLEALTLVVFVAHGFHLVLASHTHTHTYAHTYQLNQQLRPCDSQAIISSSLALWMSQKLIAKTTAIQINIRIVLLYQVLKYSVDPKNRPFDCQPSENIYPR